jgi:putative nucleotidyltransferase with HDIG domain
MSVPDQDIRNRLLVARLPAMPQILLKLLELCQSDETGMAELAKLIANDAGMTSKILNVANSAAYHRGGAKVGLLQALHVLGADMIKTLVISESVYQTFNGFPHSASNDLRGFWKHSLTAAVVAREMAKVMGYAHCEEAYLAGLLHDVGRLALLAAAPNEYSFNFTAQDSEELCAVEERSLQISHAEAGAWLIGRWNLDSFMADGVLYHHEAAERVVNAHPLIRIVHLAHWLANHDGQTPLPENAGALCQISVGDMESIRGGAAAQVIKAAAYLGVDLSGVDDVVAPVAHTAPTAPTPAVNPVQQRLSDEVRNSALMAEMGQSFARQKDDRQLLEVMRQNARILFHLENTVFLRMNGALQTLVGVSMGEQHQRLSEFSIAMSGGGAIAESARQGKLCFISREQELCGLGEDQLMRVFAADCLICVPLSAGAKCLGVLVGGVPSWQRDDLKRRERFLQAFGAQAATSLDTADRERGEVERRIAIVQDEHRQDSRRVVHEISNPLTIIKNYLGVLDDKLVGQEDVSAELSILHEEIDRVGNLLSEFAGAQPKEQKGLTEINQVVNDLVRLFRESKFLPPSVQIIARMSEQACEMDGAAGTLKQILVNLIKNAVEAMPNGGNIEVVNNGLVQRDGRAYFDLCVKDSGPGIPTQVLAKLFSPVQSTKSGVNRGIGLSIVYSLVKKLNGQISCVSSQTGTQFEIHLPAARVSVQRAAPLTSGTRH